MSDFDTETHIDGELIAEEDAGSSERPDDVRALPRRLDEADNLPALKGEVRTAALAVAGGAIAGAATVAAVRAVSGSRRRPSRRARRRERPSNIVASRSFLVDVHILGR